MSKDVCFGWGTWTHNIFKVGFLFPFKLKLLKLRSLKALKSSALLSFAVGMFGRSILAGLIYPRIYLISSHFSVFFTIPLAYLTFSDAFSH